MPVVTVNPTIDQKEKPIRIFYFDSVSGVFKGIGNPEGSVFAGEASLLVNTAGQAFVKTTPITLNTGWVQMPPMPPGGAVETSVARQIGTVSTSGTGTDPLHSVVIPANTWDVDGRKVKIIAQGAGFGAAGTKRLVGTLNGLAIFNTTLVATLNDRGWFVLIELTRLASDTLIVSCEVFFGAGLIGASQVGTVYSSHATHAGLNFTLAFTMDFFGECAVGTDSVQQYVTIASEL